MPSVNRVVLMGHLGKDAETQFTPSGVSVSKFSLATTRSWKPKDADKWEEATDWHNVVAWRCHEKLVPLLVKGNLVYVEGRLQTRSYDDKEGNKRWVTEVIAERVHFLRQPLKGGPRDEDAPSSAVSEQAPISDDDVPF